MLKNGSVINRAWLFWAVVCLLAALRVHLSVSVKWSGWPHTERCYPLPISSCQSAATAEIIKRLWSRVWLVYAVRRRYLVNVQTFYHVQTFSTNHYLRQGGYVFERFCLSLSVCWQDNSKSYARIFLKFSGNVGNGKNYKWFNFGGCLLYTSDAADE